MEIDNNAAQMRSLVPPPASRKKQPANSDVQHGTTRCCIDLECAALGYSHLSRSLVQVIVAGSLAVMVDEETSLVR